MYDRQAAARTVLSRLISLRTGGQPDGRPLHAYRFDRNEFDLAREALKSLGTDALSTWHSSALFVAFAAEWFRRDRTGGHWDWKRPLAEIGLVYGQDEPRADLSYTQIATAVDSGLRWWRRPASDGERILAIVREAGFPAAALRDGRRAADWLRNAVRLIERGFAPAEAVKSEAWRMHADSIVHATLPAAIDLCDALVGLRTIVRQRGDVAIDPIIFLDATLPDWRTALPFELEAQDVVAVIETVLRAPLDRSSALFVTRRLRHGQGFWRATAEIGLRGELEQRRLPPSLAHRLSETQRVRIVPRGELTGRASALAAMERFGDDDDAEAGWVLRPLLSGFESALPLEADVRLGAIAGDELIDEFLAYAGEALVGDAVILEPATSDEPDRADELLVLGISPVRSKRPWLAIAATPEALGRVRFDGRVSELGTCLDGRNVVAFSGTATLANEDGSSLRWQTNADKTESPRLVLVGPTVHQVRETVFKGTPRVWVEQGDICREWPRQDLRWRPRGPGRWRLLSEGAPFGNIAIGAFTSDEMVAFSAAIVVPPEFQLITSRVRGGLGVRGTTDAKLVAHGPGPLLVTRESEGDFVDLRAAKPGQTLALTLAWEARAKITLCNPVTRQALIDPDGAQASRHVTLAVERLHGYRLMTADKGHLAFELVVRSERRYTFTRQVHGEVPLVAYLDDLRNLLGSADSLDAAIRLSWIGGEDWICEIKWYDFDPEPYEHLDRTVFGASRLKLLGIETIEALAIADPGRGTASVPTDDSAAIAAELGRALGGGPWLLFGKTRHGQVLRPRTLASNGFPRDPGSELITAIRTPQIEVRSRRLDTFVSSPDQWSVADRRRLLDLVRAAAGARLPYAAFDPLRALAHRPGSAVWLLAFCENIEERSAVLALQRELPLLWTSTPVELWIEAFEARSAFLADRMEEAGIDRALALSMVVPALAQILDLAPGLAVHVRLALLVCMGTSSPNPTAGALAERLKKICAGACEADLADRTNLFVQRHVDGPPPPSNLGLALITGGARHLVERFPDGFADVIAAPIAAADGASDRRGLDIETASACRQAWLFDPEHFDSTTAVALAASGGTQARKLEGTV